MRSALISFAKQIVMQLTRLIFEVCVYLQCMGATLNMYNS